jgi:hypothetical protein
MPNKKNGKSSAQYYAENPESRKKKNAAQKKLNATPEQRKRRAELVKLNRDKGTYGNGDGKDVSHKPGGRTVLEDASKNRGAKTMPGDRRARGGKKKK